MLKQVCYLTWILLLSVQLLSANSTNFSVKNYKELLKQNKFDELYEYTKPFAEAGNAEAMTYMGLLYLDNDPSRHNPNTAFLWFIRASDKGSAKAMGNIGRMYDTGKGVQENKDQAIIWFKKAGDNGIPYGYYAAGHLYFEVGNEQEGFKFLKKAAAEHISSAFAELGDIYHKKKHYQKAIPWYQKAADNNDTFSLERLSYYYEYGKGVEKNNMIALNYLQKAANLGSSSAMNTLGNAYNLEHYGLKEDNEKAILWLKKAIKAGSIDAHESLASIYLYEKNKNYKDGFYHLKKAVDNGLILATKNLADMYMKGIWVAKDEQKAKLYYETVVQSERSKKLGWGLYELGLIYIKEGNLEQGTNYIQKAAAYDNEEALAYLVTKNKVIESEKLKHKKITLVFDPKGHTNLVTSVAKVPGKEQIITASKDKTVRVWDVKTQQEIKKFLGDIGPLNIGGINSIALSINNKYLAVGGVFDNDAKKMGVIRLYDFETTKLLKIIKGHSRSISNLKFTPDSKYLFSASGFELKVWSTKDYKEIASFNVNAITDILSSNIATVNENEHKLVAFGENSFAQKYELITYSLEKKMGIKNRLISGYKPLGVDANDKYIYVADQNNNIHIYNYELDKINTIKINATINAIHVSNQYLGIISSLKQESYLATKKQIVDIYSIQNNYKKINSAISPLNISDQLHFFEDNVALTAIGSNSFALKNIYSPIFNIQIPKDINIDQTVKAKIAKEILPNLNPQKLSNKFEQMKLGPLEQAFGIPVGIKVIEKDVLTRKILVGGVYKAVIINKNIIAISGVDDQTGIKNVYFGKVMLYNIKGDKIAELVGHNSLVKSFSFDEKHNTLFTKDTSGVTNIWDLSKLHIVNKSTELDQKKVNKLLNTFGATDYGLIDIIIGNKEDEYLDDYLKNTLQKQLGLKNLSLNDMKKMFFNSLRKVQKLTPLASMYIGADKEWVMWTEDGFFDASANGAKYIGYHINQGFDKEARFISSDQVFTEFYRPDIVKKALNKEDVSAYAKEINIAKIIKGGFAPEVKFLTRRAVTKKRDVDLTAKVCDSGGGIGKVILSLNGTNIELDGSSRKALPKDDAKDKSCYQVNMLVTLQGGANTLKLFAFNEDGTIESDIDSLKIDNKLKQASEANLYLLSIAVDKYMDRSLQLQYPVEDASSIEEEMKSITGTLYGKTKVINLYDSNVTKEKVAKAFVDISKKIKPDDVFMMFLAGHGVTDNGKYYFLPYDFKFTGLDAIEKQGISINDLRDGLLKIPAQKSLVLLDTCSSGAFTNEIVSRGLEEKMAIARLHRATGRNYIAASSDTQVALEGYEGHGVFTYTVLDALKGKGFKNKKLTVVDLAQYVEETLPEISYKKWGYMQVPQKSLSGSDFPIGLR